MKVSGFTFIRNAVKYDYPVCEAIASILPLCDEVIVSVGDSEDETLTLIQSINSPKIKIIQSTWDETLLSGRVLAVETDKAYQAISPDSEWAFYIQADEVLHERYLETVRRSMEQYKDDVGIDGLLFNYLHFYGSYDYVGEAYSWYQREIRIIRNRSDIFSYRDAQGFRKLPNNKLSVKLIDAYIYHYGWVRPPRIMLEKQTSFAGLYHGKDHAQKSHVETEFDYSAIDVLSRFTGTHPRVFHDRINRKNWRFDHDLSMNRLRFKDKLKRLVEKITGWRPGEYRNYKIV
jgi:hypothetical protein